MTQMNLIGAKKNVIDLFGNLRAFSTTTKFETLMSNASKTVKIKISSLGAGCPD